MSPATPPLDPSSVLVLALIAYSVYEHGYEGGTATHVRVRLGARACTVEDDGRGIGLHRDGYVTGLVEQLAGRQPKVAIHGLGLAVAAMVSPLLVIRSRRDGQQFTQRFAWGAAQGNIECEPWSGPSGTRITITLADEAPVIDAVAIHRQVNVWRAAHPGLGIEVVSDTVHD